MRHKAAGYEDEDEGIVEEGRQMKLKGIWILVSVLTVIGLVGGCAKPAVTQTTTQVATQTTTVTAKPAAPPETIKIGYMLWLSGGMKTLGETQMKGAKLAIAEINAAGGILGGRMLEGIFFDQGSTVEEATATAEALVKKGVKAFIGGVEAGVNLADMRVAKKYNIPAVITGGRNVDVNKEGFKGFIHIPVTSKPMANGHFAFMESQGWKTYVEVGFDHDYPRVVNEVARARWDKTGSPVKIVQTMWLPTSQVDASAEAAKVVALKPDIVNALLWGDALTSFLKTLRELKYQGAIWTISGALVPTYLAQLDPKLTDGVYVAETMYPNKDIPENWAYVQSWRQMFGQDEVPVANGYYQYEATYILAKAWDKAGTIDDINKTYEGFLTLKWTSVRGEPLVILPDGQMYISGEQILQAKGGKWVATGKIGLTGMSNYEWWKDDPSKIWWK